MKYFKYIVFVLLFVGIFIGCNPQPEASNLLIHAEKFADNEQADSAIILIDSIFYPEKSFNEEEYMQYLVTRTRARYKAYRDIRGDTAVFKAWNYYKQKKAEPRWASLAAFYSGCVYRELNDKNKAMRAYMEAFSEAKKTSDNKLKGLVQNNIGDLLSQQGLNRQALEVFRKAENYHLDYPEQRIISISNIGRSYSVMGNIDSAIITFKRGLQFADGSSDWKGKVLLEQNLSIAYSQQGKYDQALPHLKQAFKNNLDPNAVVRFYFNFADLYSLMGLTDSAKFYNDLVKGTVDHVNAPEFKISLYRLLAQTEELSKNYLSVIEYLKKEIDTYDQLLESRNNSAILDIQQKYNFELLKNSYQEDVSKYQYVVIVLLLILIFGIIVFAKYRINQKNKLIETHEKIVTLSRMASELEHLSSAKMALQEKNMRELLMWKFDVIRKAVLVTKIDSDNASTLQLAQRFHQIVYHNPQHDVWTDFEDIINHISKSLSKRIRDLFPNLSEKEYRICLLTYAGMNVKEIAVILELSSNSIQAYRTSIRKKLGIYDSKVDTEAFLMETLSDK
jgi:tetratricopeptide (TPR) repeat protein